MNVDRELVTHYTMKTGNKWGTGILLLNSDGLALVGLRTDTKTWCTPGGKVEVGETAEEGVIRETREEVSLIIKNPEFIDVLITPNNGIIWNSFCFIAKNVTGEPKPQPSEMKELEWVTIEELMSRELFPPTRRMMELYKEKGLV